MKKSLYIYLFLALCHTAVAYQPHWNINFSFIIRDSIQWKVNIGLSDPKTSCAVSLLISNNEKKICFTNPYRCIKNYMAYNIKHYCSYYLTIATHGYFYLDSNQDNGDQKNTKAFLPTTLRETECDHKLYIDLAQEQFCNWDYQFATKSGLESFRDLSNDPKLFNPSEGINNIKVLLINFFLDINKEAMRNADMLIKAKKLSSQKKIIHSINIKRRKAIVCQLLRMQKQWDPILWKLK